MTFGTDSNGEVTHAFVGLFAADKVPPLQQAGNHQLVILLALLRLLRPKSSHIKSQHSAEEARLATDFVNSQGLFALCRSLFNSNEFVYVD